MAFDRCVARGATTVVVSPYFLSPGRHWAQVRATLCCTPVTGVSLEGFGVRRRGLRLRSMLYAPSPGLNAPSPGRD